MSGRKYNWTDAIMAPVAVALSVPTLWPMTIDKTVLVRMLVASGLMLGAWGEERRSEVKMKKGPKVIGVTIVHLDQQGAHDNYLPPNPSLERVIKWIREHAEENNLSNAYIVLLDKRS
jgi:hypothetical protein